MANDTPTSSPTPSFTKWLTGLILAAFVILAAYWYYTDRSTQLETKYAFASNHYFEDPVVFFGGKGLQYELFRPDPRLLKVSLPAQKTGSPRYLLVEDGELDFLGFAKADQLFIPLQLYQIHNARSGNRETPVSDCKTYLELPANTDSILVLVDSQYLLHGKKVAPNRYVIPFCESTRQHQFQVVGRQQALARKGLSPSTYSANSFLALNSRIKSSGDTLRPLYSPVTYSNKDTAILASPVAAANNADRTKVMLSLPRRVESPWVYFNGKRQKDFDLNAARNQVIFWVNRSRKALSVRVGDRNCECSASGYPLHSTLELAAYCDCRDIQVTVNLDPGVDRFRNKIRIYIDGQLTDMDLPPAGKPFTFPIRKTGQDQQVELKLLLVDDTGKAGLIDVCDFTVPAEATTANLNPSCHCVDCPPNIKISG